MPARRCLNAIQGGDGAVCGEVRTCFAVVNLQFSQGEDVIATALSEFYGGDAHIAADDAVIPCGGGFKGLQPRIGEVVHEGEIVFLPNKSDSRLESGVITDFDLETHRETETAADLAEVVIAGFQNDASDLNAFAEVDLDPFDGVLAG